MSAASGKPPFDPPLSPRTGAFRAQRCHFCSEPVDPDSPRTWRRVIGWGRKASPHSSRKGGSDVALREHLDEFACDFCVSQVKRGVAPTQGALL